MSIRTHPLDFDMEKNLLVKLSALQQTSDFDMEETLLVKPTWPSLMGIWFIECSWGKF